MAGRLRAMAQIPSIDENSFTPREDDSGREPTLRPTRRGLKALVARLLFGAGRSKFGADNTGCRPPRAFIEKPEYVQRGGLWVNGSFMSWPMARIEIFRDHFRVQHARFSPDNLIALDEVWSGLGNGIHIRHRNPNAPKQMVFWPINMGSLRRELVRRGYHVDRGGFAWALLFKRESATTDRPATRF
jgi:hypothetical protein